MINYLKTQSQLIAHKAWVFWFIFKICGKLMWRATKHDFSKFSNDEALLFSKKEGKLGVTRFGTPEYDELKKSVQPAIEHHYKHNSHHPEHYPDGYKGMSALDRIEMACDMCAATKRTADGDIRYSIEYNQERFKYSDIDKEWLHSLVDELERRKQPRRKD